MFPSDCTAKYLHGRTEICTHRSLHLSVYSRLSVFIVIKNWKQPSSPSLGEQTYQLWYICTMEYYSMIKKKELWSHKNTWRNFKCILLWEQSNLKTLHALQFQLCDILVKEKLSSKKMNSISRNLGDGMRDEQVKHQLIGDF